MDVAGDSDRFRQVPQRTVEGIADRWLVASFQFVLGAGGPPEVRDRRVLEHRRPQGLRLGSDLAVNPRVVREEIAEQAVDERRPSKGLLDEERIVGQGRVQRAQPIGVARASGDSFHFPLQRVPRDRRLPPGRQHDRLLQGLPDFGLGPLSRSGRLGHGA